MHFVQKIVHLRVWNTKRVSFIEEIMQKSHLNNLYAIRLITTKVFGSPGKRLIFLSNSNAKFDPKFFAISLVSGNFLLAKRAKTNNIKNWHIIVSRFFIFFDFQGLVTQISNYGIFVAKVVFLLTKATVRPLPASNSAPTANGWPLVAKKVQSRSVYKDFKKPISLFIHCK